MKHHISFDIDFRKNPYKGIYIAFEGIDGSGKSTQARLLKEYFEKKGKTTILAHEPTKVPPIGELLHSIIQKKIKIQPISLQYLFAADREIHAKTVIEPALEAGEIVVADRCFWSSVAYGAADKIQGLEELNGNEILLISQSILSFYHQFIAPDMTFYLKVPEDIAIERLSKSKKQREYYEEIDKLKKIEEGYDWLAEKFPEEISVVDGEASIEEVAMEVIKIINSK